MISNNGCKEDIEEQLPVDETSFLLVADNSRHQSLRPTLANVRRSLARSLTGGYPGARPDDIGRVSFAIDFRTEYNDVKQAIKDHVKEAQEGKDYLLEMTLTRTLSIIPNKRDVQAVADGFVGMVESLRGLPRNLMGTSTVHGDDDDDLLKTGRDSLDTTSTYTGTDDESGHPVMEEEQTPKKKKIPIHAYVTLLTAVTALSSIGPFLDRLVGVAAPLRIVWRQQGTALVLWPFALRSILLDGPPKLSIAQWCTFLLASFSYSVLTVAFSMSVDYTTVNDAAILTNSQSLLLVIAKFCIGSPVHIMESAGVAVAFGGAFMCSRDSSEAVKSMSDETTSPWTSVYGDCLALLSAVGGLGYIMLGKSLRSHVEVYVFMTLNMILGNQMILLFMWLTGQEFSFDRHIDHGVFGWANWDPNRLPIELAVVFLCNIMGTMGYVRAFKYFNSVIISVAALLEPVTATLIAIALNVGVFPGVLGCIGNVMVILGTLSVIYPSAVEEE